MKILLIDNYDSFTYNLMHYMEGFDVSVTTIYNDQIDLEEVSKYDQIVLSPGPGLPHEAGKMNDVIQRYVHEKPFLGVCLGFQALAEFFGGKLYNQQKVKHGIAEMGHFDQSSKLFSNTDDQFKIGLYHSWAVTPVKFPDSLSITGKSENDIIMAFEHKKLPVAGVQFHPESILSEHGKKIVENFIFNFR